MPGLDQEEILIERCQVEAIDLLPYLKLNVGLKVSICTGNASRRTLWDAVCFSFAARDEAGSFFCDYHVADFDCAVRCWDQESPSPSNTMNTTSLIPNRDALQRGLENFLDSCASAHRGPG